MPSIAHIPFDSKRYPHIQRFRLLKNGKVHEYAYHRKAKRRLIAPPGSPEFDAEYRLIQDQLPPEEKPKGCYVYVVQAVTLGLVKIGKANWPESRIEGIRTGCPDEMRVLGFLHDLTGKLESSLHARFAEHRVRGEWFSPAPELMAWVSESCLPTFREAVRARKG
jgi:hypothetical protein